MKRTFVPALCLLACLLTGSASARPLSQDPSFVSPSETPVIRKVLDNGLVVLLKEIHSAPIVSLRAYVRTGSATETPFIGAGVSHVVEHMLFKGTKTREVGEIEKEIRSYGGDINAFTSLDVTGFSVVVDRSHVKEALAVLADALMHSSFDPQEFEREREVVLKEIRLNQDDPSRRIYWLLWQRTYQTHPYRHPVIGYETLLKQLRRDEVFQFYRQHYVANNMVLALAGDFDSQEALKEVERLFEPFERALLPDTVSPEEPPQRSPRRYQEEAEVQLAHLMLGYHTVSVSHDDLYPLDLLAILLGQGESGRLQTVLRKEKRLVYTIGSFNYTPKDPGLFVVSAQLEREKLPKAQAAIEDEIQWFKNHLVSDRELEKAKRQVLADYFFGLETIEEQAADLAENDILTGDPLFSKTYVEGISRVKAEEIQQVARRYLRPENRTEVSLVPKAKQEEAIVVAEEKASQLPIVPLTLSNGLRVLLRPDPTHPIVSFEAAFLGGLRFEEEKTEGISRFVSELLLKGTKRWSEKELAQWIDSVGGSLNPFSGQNSFGLQFKVLSSETEEALDRLQEILLSPTFPPQEIEKERERTLASIRAEEDDIFRIASKRLKRLLYQKHPYRFDPLGSPQSISNLSRQDLLHFYEKVRLAPQMVLAVFGDFQIEEMRLTLEKRFVSLPAQPRLIHPPQEEPQRAPRVLTEERPKVQAILMLGYPICPLTHPDRPALELLAQLLSGGGGRLFHEIRDKEGQAYTLGAYPAWGLDPGHFLFYVSTSKDEIASVEQKLLHTIRRLQEEPAQEEEVAIAKKSLIGMHRVSLQTNAALAFQASLDTLYGLGFDEYLRYEEKISRVTAADLSRVARTYFRPETVSIVRILPKHASP